MSNKSLFNKTLLKKDFKLTLGAFVVTIIYGLINHLFRISQMIDNFKNTANHNHSYLLQSSQRLGDFDMVFFLIALVTSIVLFSGEKKNKSIEMMVASPFSRKQIYLSKLLTGLFTTIIPYSVILSIAYAMVSTNPLLSSIVSLDQLAISYITSILAALCGFAYFSMICMLFGSSLASGFCGLILTTMPAGIFYMLDNIVDRSSTHKLADILSHFTPFRYFVTLLDGPSLLALLIIVAFSLIFFLAGYFLFETYKMEKNSEFLTFKFTEPIFRIGFFICSLLLGANFVQVLLGEYVHFEMINYAIGFIIGGAFGYFIPKILIQKNRGA